jgi:hypothetical protein
LVKLSWFFDNPGSAPTESAFALEVITMLKTSFHVRRNTNPKRSKSCRPRIEWMETRTLLSPPTITGLNPTSGSEAGGTSVAITGTNFTGATVVDFGTTAASDLTVVNGADGHRH